LLCGAIEEVSQIRGYESGQSQPTLDAIRKLAVSLSVSADNRAPS
jgi:transcriptional regulator with XRE-family HTH domain